MSMLPNSNTYLCPILPEPANGFPSTSCVFAGLCGQNAPLLLSSLLPILPFRPNASTSIPHRSSSVSIPWCLSGFVPSPCYTGCGASAGLGSVKYSIPQGQLCKQAASGRNIRWDKQGWREKVLREQSLCQGTETYFKQRILVLNVRSGC